ncbi:ragulator complex protein LAMTOR5 domain-containing protein [Phthorimaea operculella]|nr:ragulator complex protein LAMTOR5 domain-containing protein [Phthorimaea operculella]
MEKELDIQVEKIMSTPNVNGCLIADHKGLCLAASGSSCRFCWNSRGYIGAGVQDTAQPEASDRLLGNRQEAVPYSATRNHHWCNIQTESLGYSNTAPCQEKSRQD